jgi:hypothetical protein
VADQRIKGQEVSITVVEGGSPLQTINDIRSFSVAGMLETQTEGYLGETTDRRDEIYRGFRGDIELHFENRDVLDLIRRIIDRARRREPGIVINIKATLVFPNGQRVRVLMKDVFFGEIPIAFGDRSAYGTVSMSFEGNDFSVI